MPQAAAIITDAAAPPATWRFGQGISGPAILNTGNATQILQPGQKRPDANFSNVMPAS
jgi:hypothetical protein